LRKCDQTLNIVRLANSKSYIVTKETIVHGQKM
jgi:hypothetical protein